ncbi:hypothetical protein C6P42_001664 [Pichia californica]|nr:hypothetical protein C6P42_001664 [[Candida] californica]
MSSSPLLRRNTSKNSNSTSSLRNYNSIQRTPHQGGATSTAGTGSTSYLPNNNASGSPYLQKRKGNKSSNENRKEINNNNNKQIKKKLNNKLGTLNGVTLPTILNVLSILMFLRFGFIIGQMGILGTIFLLLISYGIDLLTTLSISAIATNGTVKGGGAYYMLSRSLGVEFGGAIGVIFYIGQILNSSMNVAGVIEPILYNFSKENGVLIKILPTSYWWQFTYCSIFLFLCIIIALIGSNAVSKAGTYLCIILIFSTLSIPISAFFVSPFESNFGFYTGLSWNIFKENLFPNFTKGAAGSQINEIETFNDLFGIFFPATAGILAGASMSGDLANPSKSIPNGTLNGLIITFSSYFIVIISMGSSIPRKLLYNDTQILQTINLSPFIILAGEMSTSIFSIIVGIIGAAKLLQAIARDEILPGLKIFGNGDLKNDDPKEAIILTYIICQLFLFADLNQIATLITMAFLMTFIVTNMSCALLKIGSAPNFRPSFKYFSTKSALAGTLSCLFAMFIVDGFSACVVIATLLLLILMIHFLSPPKSWGDVSQSLIYHQVRKYLLKLRQDNVKYWRPQILLLVDNPRTSWKLISFCNNLKKGGLYVLGHVFITNNFQDNVNELSRSRENWIKIRDIIKVKAFVQISISPTFSWGVRNIFLGSGLGGMKPNITIIGFYDLARYKGNCKIPKNLKFESLSNQFQNQVKIEINDLPTDKRAKFAPKIKITEWVQILEDLSLLNSNIAVAKGFPRLEIPNNEILNDNNKKYIDLYPIQMAQRLDSDEGILTTNFDTCTLILQMGAILNTVPNWKHSHIIRVVVFVEFEKDVNEEFIRVKKLLEILRMQEAKIEVICFENGGLKIYDYISHGNEEFIEFGIKKRINELLKEDEWWNNVCKIRGKEIDIYGDGDGNNSNNRMSLSVPNNNNRNNNYKIMHGMNSRRMTMNKINQLGISFGSMNFQTNKFSNKELNNIFNKRDDDITDISRSNSDLESIESEFERERDNNENNTLNDSNKRPIFLHMKSNNSLRRMKKSAFTAERLPNSTIKENAEGNEASIMFDGEIEEGGKVKNKKIKNNEEGKVNEEMGIKGEEALVDEDSGEEGNEGNEGNEDGNETDNENNNIENENENENNDNRSIESEFNIGEEVNEAAEGEFVVKFEDMTRRCQFMVLNEMMVKQSKDTDLIFTTLPIPEVGLHHNEVESVDYVVDLEVWTERLPAMLLMNAKTVTVTSNL